MENDIVLNEFKNKMISAPEVNQCYSVTGNVDLILIISIKDMSEFEKFAESFLIENPNVKSFTTNIVIREIKSQFFIP